MLHLFVFGQISCHILTSTGQYMLPCSAHAYSIGTEHMHTASARSHTVHVSLCACFNTRGGPNAYPWCTVNCHHTVPDADGAWLRHWAVLCSANGARYRKGSCIRWLSCGHAGTRCTTCSRKIHRSTLATLLVAGRGARSHTPVANIHVQYQDGSPKHAAKGPNNATYAKYAWRPQQQYPGHFFGHASCILYDHLL